MTACCSHLRGHSPHAFAPAQEVEEDVNEEEQQQLAAALQATMITLYMILTLLNDDGLCTVSCCWMGPSRD